MSSTTTPKITLSNGVEMPLLGLGTWQATDATRQAVEWALVDSGYRLLDTAEGYNNEHIIGETLEKVFAQGKIKREDIFITDKLWTNHFTPEKGEAAIKVSLEKLKTKYVDLLLAHMPIATDDNFEHQPSISLVDIWRTLEYLYEKGYARAIGVSNWNADQIERVMKVAKVPIHVNQIELHLYLQQHEVHDACKKHNIAVTSYGSLGSPGRFEYTVKGFKVDWPESPVALEDKKVVALAEKYQKTPGQVILRYLAQRGIGLIPRSLNKGRIAQNIDIFDFELSKDEITDLEDTPYKQRLFEQPFMIGHPEDPFLNERGANMGNQPLIAMSNGTKMPMIGLGTWLTDSEDQKAALNKAIDIGYRAIDTAAAYGNEELIGAVLKENFESGKLKRDDIFITTKIWPTHLHPSRQEESITGSLKRLGLDYVDLLLAHMPTTNELDAVTHDKTVTVEDIWKGFEKLYEKGYAKAIGVSNWSIPQLERALKIAKIPIHNHQIELHIYWPQDELVDFCKKHFITVTSYGSLGSPGRTTQNLFNGIPLGWKESPDAMKEPLVVEIAARYNKTPSQVLLRWIIQRGICIIPKSANPKRLEQNFDITDFKLTDEEMEDLSTKVTHRQRLFVQEHMIGHPEDSFKDER